MFSALPPPAAASHPWPSRAPRSSPSRASAATASRSCISSKSSSKDCCFCFDCFLGKDHGCETTRGSCGSPFLGGHRPAESASVMAGRPSRPWFWPHWLMGFSPTFVLGVVRPSKKPNPNFLFYFLPFWGWPDLPQWPPLWFLYFLYFSFLVLIF